jgi:dsRNA-specific ribonuclease
MNHRESTPSPAPSLSELILMPDDVAPKFSFPPLPELPTDLALQVFTDPSLRPPGENGSSHTDNEVLSVVGMAATQAAYSAILFEREPRLTAEALKARSQKESKVLC